MEKSKLLAKLRAILDALSDPPPATLPCFRCPQIEAAENRLDDLIGEIEKEKPA